MSLPTGRPPRVSIAIPCYNQAHYLGACLRSLIDQTDPDWQAIVVDDCSPGEHLIREVVEEIGDDRVRLIRHDVNRGLAGSRNTGIKSSDTELILCLDSDDLLEPRYLELIVPALTQDDSIDAAFPNVRAFGRRNDLIRFWVPAPGEILRMQSMPGAGTMMRRRVWERVGGYDEAEILRLGREDWEFYVRAFAGPMKVVHVPEPLYLYRTSQASMTTECRAQEHRLATYIYDKNKAIFDAAGAGNAFLSFFHHRAALANLRKGERRLAVRLAWRGLRLAPSMLRLKTMLRAMTPLSVHLAWRRGMLRRLIPLLGYPLRGTAGEAPFFVLAADRGSGELVRRILTGHPGLYMPPESMWIHTLIRPFRRAGRAMLWPDLMRLVIAHFAFDPETPVDALAPICNRLLDVERGERNLAHVIDRVMRYRAECLGQWDVCWGDRILRDRAERLSFAAQTPTPLSRLVDVFPAARFLHVVRDGCDVVCANQRDGAAGLADTAKSWVDDVAEFRRFTGAHAARSLELRYESTRRDPAAARREICRFLGVEVDWSQDPISIETVVGRERFAPAVLRELQGLIGQELAAWGYPPCTA